MEKKRLRLLFMGTPEFAVESLLALSKSNHDIIRVISAPDKPRGRGQHLSPTPVKAEALRLGLPVLTPPDLKDPAFFDEISALKPDLCVIVAFRILPLSLVNLPRFGTINLHGSLLPAYRGAAPIQWAVACGEKETGVTVFFLNRVIDGGEIIRSDKIAIGQDETAGELYERLKILGASTLCAAVNDIASGQATPHHQDESRVSQAPKLKKEHGKIDLSRPAREVYNLIRGMTPIPGAWLRHDHRTIQVVRAVLLCETGKGEPGRVVKTGPEGLDIQTGCGILRLLSVKPESRGPMTAADFCNGFRIHENSRFN
ncbi:MAG: methionyl-tRNA formyltransferase [Elusimicrobia bacterium RIFOXYB2_FULL_49_7]|nr:MAG: methionyl-tRNA formyltransferase [Elusimicrobia bacterium RIFOXYB2_FULL_49_7]